MSLTFDELRQANKQRLPLFRNAQGEICHDNKDGTDWTPSDWVVAVVGELGEGANIIKKMRRGDFGKPTDARYKSAREFLLREFADVIIYMDLLALQFDIDLGEAVTTKFNEKSREVKANVFI